MKTLLAAALMLAATLPARAQDPIPAATPVQYYAPHYGPERDYYGQRPYYRPERAFGRHCEAVARTPYGPRQVFCRIIEAKPLGMECACPPPPSPPGYPPGPYAQGSTVR